MDKISNEDLIELKNAAQNRNYNKVLLEKATLEDANSELQLQNLYLTKFIKYGLAIEDEIENDGSIKRKIVPEIKISEPEIHKKSIKKNIIKEVSNEK